MNDLKKIITAPRLCALVVSAVVTFCFSAFFIYYTSQHITTATITRNALAAGSMLALLGLGPFFVMRGLSRRRLSARLLRPAHMGAESHAGERRLMAAFAVLRDGVFISNSRYRIEYANQAAIAMFGPAGDRTCHDYCSGLAHACPWCERGASAPKNIVRHEYYHERLGRYYEITASPIENSAGTVSMLHVVQDITDTKKSSDVLLASGEKFRSCIEQYRDGIVLCDADGRVVEWNRELERITQQSRDAVIGQYIWDVSSAVVSENNGGVAALRKYRDMAQSIIAGGPPAAGQQPAEFCFRRADGTQVHVEQVLLPLKTGDAFLWGGICRDISARKGIEEALRASENKYRELVEHANSIILRLDTRGAVLFANTFALKFFGYEEAELVGRSVIGTIVPLRDSTGRDLAQMVEGIIASPDTFADHENENMRKSGELVWVHWSNRALYDPAGNMREILCIGTDITERRKVEVALKESERRLRSSQKLAHLGDWEFNIMTGELYWSDELYRLLEYPPGEIPPSFRAWIKSVHPDDRRTMLGAAAYRGTEPRQDEYRMVCKNGAIRYLYSEIWMEAATDGRLVLARGILQDITFRKIIERELGRHRDQLDELVQQRTAKLEREMLERRKKEEALGASEARFRGLVANIPGVVYRIACDAHEPMLAWRIDYVSDQAETIAGRPASLFSGKTLGFYFDFIHADDVAGIMATLSQQIALGQPYALEYRLTHSDGSLRWVLSRGQAHRDESGRIRFLDGVIFDVTARKQAEQTLHASQERFRAIAESASDGIAIVDEDLNIIYWNNGAARMFGYSSREVLGKSHDLFVPEELREQAAGGVAAYRATGELPFGENPYQTAARRKDGTIIQVSMSVSQWEVDGKTYYGSITRDVTERSRMQTALEYSEAQLRAFTEASPDAMIMTDTGLNVLYWSAAAEKMFGYSRQEMLGTYPERIMLPGVSGRIDNALAGLNPDIPAPFEQKHIETRMVRRDGQEIPCELSFFQWETNGQTFLGALIRDITVRKKAEEALQQSEAQFRAFAETSPDVVIMADSAMHIMYWNTAAEQIYGYSSREMLGRTPECLIGSGVRPHRDDELEGLRETGSTPFSDGFMESTGHRKDGTEFPCEVAVFQWEIEGRLYFGVILRDITERKAAAEALRQSEARFRAFAATSPDAVIMADMQMHILYWNAAAERIFGYSRQEMLGLQPDCLMGRGVKQRQAAAVAELSTTGESPFMDSFAESTGRRKDGSEFPCELAVFQWEAAGQFMVGVILRDITQRKAAAKALRQSQERYRGMLNAITTYTYSVEVDGGRDVSVRHSQGCFAVTGYQPEEHAANPLLWHSMIHPEDRPAVDRTIADLHGGGRISPLEHRIVKPDGATVWVRNTMVPYRAEGGRLLRYDGIIENITERKLAEEALRASQEMLDGILSAVTEYMIMLDEDLTIVWANDQAARTFGGDIIGRKCHEAYLGSAAPCAACPARRCFADGRPAEQELVISAPGGRKLNVWCTASVAARSEDGTPRHLIYIAHDITERKLMQAEALRAAHLASIGELAAGVAHEINNPINGIINCADILKHQFHKRHDDPDVPVRIIKEGERVAAIVRNLLTFARERKSKKEPCSIRTIYDDAIALLSKQFEKNFIRISTLFADDLPPVIAQPQQIQQVLMNLLSNARYALNKKYPSRDPGKRLEITAQAVTIDGRRFVRMIFYDRGTGAPQGDLEKLCNPFFTTKPPGEGTGLGLSISYNIIKDHGGALAFESTEGDCMRVTVDLPAEV